MRAVHVLVLNCGSSSVKADVIVAGTGERLQTVRLDRLSSGEHATKLAPVLQELVESHRIDAVGHRVVHGGDSFTAPTLIADDVRDALQALVPLAPLHNPVNIAGIDAATEAIPDVPHVAVFDTGFHRTLPRRAKHYALASVLTERHGIRRFGFHGTSHQWVAQQAARFVGEELRNLRVVTCHLGNGASACAIEYGRSVETSMGMTPLEGLVMGTRSGDVDAGVLLQLMRAEALSVDQMDSLLNRESGLAGVSGTTGDMRDIEQRAQDGDDDARLAITLFTHRIRKYIGAYAAVMGGVDAIVFTAGIGQNSALIRQRVAQRLGFLGARLDEDRNRDARVDAKAPVVEISEPGSRTKLLVVATDEAWAIAKQTADIVSQQTIDQTSTIPVAVSARHIHLTDEAVEALYGNGHQLTPDKPLSQPGQFACKERLTIIGPKRNIEGVRVLGPTRSKCQIEISRTDEFHLGVDAPVRDSGDVGNSPGVTLEGPTGRLTLKEGLICARRHIHMTPDDAKNFGVKHGDVVSVTLDTDRRDLTFGDVLVRVSPKYKLEMHIDTDEANAADLNPGQQGALVATGAGVRLVGTSRVDQSAL